MRKFVAKGGYGEHGRSCFLTEYGKEGRFYMVDCGILDSDSIPWPQVSAEELAATDYLFLTHCHKDHCGAFDRLVEQGFRGVLVTTRMTLLLSRICYPNTVVLPADFAEGPAVQTLGELTLTYGRSGHCPGGIWLLVRDLRGCVFFSGDYQADTLAYACDRVQGRQAELAVADCAHAETTLLAGPLRRSLTKKLAAHLAAGRRVILPLPRFGRGAEISMLLQKEFPGAKVAADSGFAADFQKNLTESGWYRESAYDTLQGISEKWEKEKGVLVLEDEQPQVCQFDILLLGDTHLQKESSRRFVEQAAAQGAAVLVTGRVKPGCLPQRLLKEKKAERVLFPHHQSRGDLQMMLAENSFACVLPFHNEKKEVILG